MFIQCCLSLYSTRAYFDVAWTVLDHKSGEESTETFDAVMVCTGHHAEKRVPSFPGLADFKGEVLHSHDYREPSRFTGKRVVVIGIGNSGGDMAVELSRQGQVGCLCEQAGTGGLSL